MELLDRLGPGSRVLLVRLRSLGDCVLTTPAIEILARRRPDLKIGVVVEDRFRGVYEGNPRISALLAPDAAEVFRFRPTLSLNLHGGTRSTMLTAASQARFRAGFGHYRFQWVYNVAIPRAQEILGEERKVHTAEHVASAMFFLGIPRTEIPRAALYFDGRPREGRYAVIHPVAAAPEKTWPSDKFARVATELSSCGIEPVFIGAAQDDLSSFAGFQQLQGAPLNDVKRLLGGATVFVGNDSGPAHMAAAFGVPVAVLYGSSDPVIWAPWRTKNAIFIAGAGGIASIQAEDVLESALQLAGSE